MQETREFLAKEYRKKYPSFKTVNDGILDSEIFFKQKKKVLYLLKETYGDFCHIQGQQDIFNGNRSPFWPNIHNWTNAVLDENNTYSCKAKILEKTRFIDNVAYVNVKKINENKKKSTYRNILKFAHQDSELLRFQINSINPDVIFTSSNTLDAYRIIYRDEELNHINEVSCGRQLFHLYSHRGRSIIKTFHPSAFPVKQEKAFKTIQSLIFNY